MTAIQTELVEPASVATSEQDALTTQDPDGLHRRSALSRLASGGIVVIGALAGLLTRREEAAASHYCNHVGCCYLAYCSDRWCTVYGAACEQVRCPSGYRLRSWQCAWGSGSYYICYECTTGQNCYQGSFACSRARHSAGCN